MTVSYLCTEIRHQQRTFSVHVRKQLDMPASALAEAVMDFSAIIVAAGSGSRAGGSPKQWRMLNGRAVASWSVDAFRAAGAQTIVVVVGQGHERDAQRLLGAGEVKIVRGGASRTGSVRAGLLAAGEVEVVMIHDAARPLVEPRHIHELLVALDDADGALPALPVADTLKRELVDQIVTVEREGLYRAQTPQAFHRQKLALAYAGWPDEAPATDDAAILEAAGGRVKLIPGDALLMKITHPEDFALIERLAGGGARITCIGQGFDAHRFGPGDGVWLCGVKIAHDLTLIGHSDADAGLHALTDAMLGAIGCGDIGDHFPPTDPKWKGAASDQFLNHALELVQARGGRVVNLDVTLICEQPRIKPHRQAMRSRLANLVQIPLERVSVKATTTEGMGFTGRSEGLAAQAIVAIDLPA